MPKEGSTGSGGAVALAEYVRAQRGSARDLVCHGDGGALADREKECAIEGVDEA